ncbi:MAG: hypothetical protein M3O82_10155 [Verrucomicrobiota bacterium]|nr:hypothetical protein [Verrucomicrobiota bacterium]
MRGNLLRLFSEQSFELFAVENFQPLLVRAFFVAAFPISILLIPKSAFKVPQKFAAASDRGGERLHNHTSLPVAAVGVR